MVIKVDVRQILHGRPRMLTRDLFAVAITFNVQNKLHPSIERTRCSLLWTVSASSNRQIFEAIASLQPLRLPGGRTECNKPRIIRPYDVPEYNDHIGSLPLVYHVYAM